MKVQAIIPAAGVGQRLKTDVSKPFVRINGKPLCVHTLEVFQKSPFVESIIVVGHADHLFELGDMIKKYHLDKVIKIVAGGETRRQSVSNGLAVVDENTDVVMVHDGARPMVTEAIIMDALGLMKTHEAVVVAVPVKSTVKRVGSEDLIVKETLDRGELWEIQTPQVFKKEVLVRAHAQVKEDTPTDDAMMVEQLGIPVRILPGDYKNIKVTTREDLEVAELFCKRVNYREKIMTQRIGIGYDIHRLAEGRKLILGGVEIPYARGLDGHSDADVLLHAVCDAILGALGKGDIGEHFPNTDPQYKDIPSLTLLEKVMAVADSENYQVGNIDCVIQAEEPNLKEFKPHMRANIAEKLNIKAESVNIKATTQEQLGAIGNKEGIAAFASVLLIPR